ncbi:MAG TPA: hypothetical protein VJT31_01785 [Rugosimonospora sp.]|nr:hypothetical protein [Rugosimonospora sp.]
MAGFTGAVISLVVAFVASLILRISERLLFKGRPGEVQRAMLADLVRLRRLPDTRNEPDSPPSWWDSDRAQG